MNDMHPVRNYSEALDFVKRTDLVIDVFSGLNDWLIKQSEKAYMLQSSFMPT